MFDFEFQRCTRHCAKTDREFKPGETFFSALLREDSAVVRYDYAEEAWEQPPENALGWWKSQMPEPNAKRLNWAPNDVMLHYFQQLDGDDAKQDVRYVLALLMIRRRVVRLEETRTDSGHETLVMYCPKNESEYTTVVVEPTGERVKQIQDELSQLLFAKAA
jgi:hypothetical protein